MPISFMDLTRDVAAHREEYLLAAARVLDSGIFSLGPEVEKFEKAFAEYLGVKHVVGVSGGTMALYAAFLALDLEKGSEVLIPANTFIATAEAAVMAGLVPVFFDIDPVTYLGNLEDAARRVTSKTKVIAMVHLYGLAADMSAVKDFAASRGLFVVEDVAQAVGAKWSGQRVGSFGTISCFSFYPTKNLGSLGEGGAVATNNESLAKKIRAIRVHGILEIKYRHDIFGSNLKMEALQGAFLAARLMRLEGKNARRREIAQRYEVGLAGLPIQLPGNVGEGHVYHLYVIQTEQRERLRTELEKQGIGTGVHYPSPVHLQPSFAFCGQRAGDSPVAERVAERILSLPMFPELTDVEIGGVIRAIWKILES